MSTRARILLADDEPDFLDRIRLRFEQRNKLPSATYEYEVLAVADGTTARACLESQDFDVAILDIQMPGVSGLELAEESRRRGDDIGIILLTGHGDRDQAVRAVNAHVDYWIDKTEYTPEDLLDKVDRLVEGVSLEEVRRMLGPQPPTGDDMG
jgi:CheY-like chemotaxis protein